MPRDDRTGLMRGARTGDRPALPRATLCVAIFCVAGLCLVAPTGAAEEESEAPPLDNRGICTLIGKEAAARRLPAGFLARLIWQESRFDRFAVSPKGAQGIAQFMPTTATERHLDDPFDIPSALAASAALLSDLNAAFGNLGLAAAAYNAGADRVTRWLAGNASLPRETQDYVLAITGLAAIDWTDNEIEAPSFALDGDGGFTAACLRLAASGPATAPVATGPAMPWGMQLAADFSRERALARFTRLQKQYDAVLGAATPMVARTRAPARGPRPLFAVRIGAQTRGEAEDLCGKLRRLGGSCIVMKN